MSKIVLGAIVEGLSTRNDGSFKIVIGTQEIDKSHVGELFGLTNKFCKVLITDNNISPIEEELIDATEMKSGKKSKSQSQRLRSVLFRVHEQQKPAIEFDDWYKSELERIIDHYKAKLDD